MKTIPTDASVAVFLEETVTDADRKEDCYRILNLMSELTGEEPVMWGDSIVGFGAYRYQYESGRKGEWFLTGFSPRKKNLTLYISSGFYRYTELMTRLGKHKTGKSCLYINRLNDVDTGVLKELIAESVEYLRSLT